MARQNFRARLSLGGPYPYEGSLEWQRQRQRRTTTASSSSEEEEDDHDDDDDEEEENPTVAERKIIEIEHNDDDDDDDDSDDNNSDKKLIAPKPRERPLPSETNIISDGAEVGIQEKELFAIKRIQDGVTELPAKTDQLWTNPNHETASSNDSHNTKMIASLPRGPEQGITRPTTSAENDKKRNRRQVPSISPVSRTPRPNVDIILSLKDPIYRSVMMDFFRLLGKKKSYNCAKSDADSSEEAKEALLLLKNRNKTNEACKEEEEGDGDDPTTTQVRFFKPTSRYDVNGTFVEVDEKTALRKIRSDICRRMDSAKLWMNSNDDTGMSDVHDEMGSDNMRFRSSLLQSRPTKIAENEKKKKRGGSNENSQLRQVQPNYDGDSDSDKSPTTRTPRPNVDIILSLKDPIYRSVMMDFFRLLGEKNSNNCAKSDADSSEEAKEALLLLKNRNKTNESCKEEEEGGDDDPTTTQVRFFKPTSRYEVHGTFVEVDEKTALQKIRSDICRRMDSAKLWMNSNDDTGISDNIKVRPSLLQARPAFAENGKKRKRGGSIENSQFQQMQPNYNGDYNRKKSWMSHGPRPNVDVVLSLNDPHYRTVMIKFYQLLGKKDDNISNENNSDTRLGEMAMEALLLFKNRYKNDKVAEDTATSMSKVRFFKPSLRNAKSGMLMEVDETAALKKIRSDMSRRMDSSNTWLNVADETSATKSDDDDDGSDSKCCLIPVPLLQDRQQGKPQPTTLSSAGNDTKRKQRKDGFDNSPQSLPFLRESNLDVAEIIVNEELQAFNNCNDWQYDEVVNFFRGLYVYGWNEWKFVSKIVATKKFKHVKEYAVLLGRRFPVLRDFFSPMSVHMQGLQLDDRIKQVETGGVTISVDDEFRKRNRTRNSNDIGIEEDATLLATDMMNPNSRGITTQEYTASSVTDTATSKYTSTMPKVVICLGDFSIDTELFPSLLQHCRDQVWQTETFPDYFDPSLRPSVPTNSKQIFIPGNRVFARWLKVDNPGSYGAWYPGLIIGSKLSPIQDQLNSSDTPHLLYHVRFDDDAEGFDLDTEDIMMYDQFQAWLKDLDRYYSLPVPKKNPLLRLSKHTRVYAKWIDQTDPELFGSWVPGKVVNSKVYKDETQRRWKYHIMFDNGDQDMEMKDDDVIIEDVYKSLIEEKMNQGLIKMKGLSGLDLIVEATKVAKICTDKSSTDNSRNWRSLNL